MRERLERWWAIVPVEVFLSLLVVAVAAGTGYQCNQAAAFREELATLDQKMTRAQDEVRSYRQENDVAALREELRQLRDGSLRANLPTRQEALQLGIALSREASSRNVEVVTFASVDTTIPLREEERWPALEVSLEAGGPLERLVELMDVVDSMSGARVQLLTLDQDVAASAEWVMALTVVVPYRE